MSLLPEFRKRGMFRVAGVYAVAGWIVAQAAALAENAFGLPTWFDSAVIVVLLLGFPILMVAGWAFELTPDGLRRAAPADPGAAPGRLASTDMALLGLVVILLGITAYQIVADRDGRAPARIADGSNSIAVLPFADLSAEGDQEYFSDGLSEELLNVLSQIPELRVAGRTSSFAFKGQNADLRTIGDTLGVAHILEGSVRKSGDRLRITAQLVSAADGYHLWSETYDRELTDIFAVQEEIAAAVAGALSITLGVGDATPGGGASNTDAYDLYFRAAALARSRTPADLLRAADVMRAAIALDPEFMRARAALASLYVPILVLFPERTEQSVAELEDVVAGALAQAPGDPMAHFADAILRLQRHEWIEAEAAFQRAATADGMLGETPYRAVFLTNVGRMSDAVEELNARLSQDPLSADVTNFLQQALTATSRFEEAETEYRRSLDIGVRLAPIEHMALLRAWYGGDQALIGERFDRYIAAQTVRSPLDEAVRAVYDDPAAALALVREAADRPDMQDATRQLLIAIYAGQFGDAELATRALRRSLLDMNGAFGQALWFPTFAEARRTQAFEDLLRDLGIVEYWRATGNWGDFCRPVDAGDFACD